MHARILRRTVMSTKKVASNLEWQAWGKHDPLYGVATWPGKEKDGSSPWTADEFYEVGQRDWDRFHARWREYGLSYSACAEIGCGAGRVTRQLARDFQAVHALDVSQDMLAYARKHVVDERVQFHLTDGASLPIENGAVSAIFSCHVFQHFHSLDVARENFRQIYRVLDAGGTIMIHLPVHTWPRPVQVHKFLHSTYKAFALTKLALNRLLLRAGLFRPVMRTLSYPVDWLFRELQQIGFQRVELVLIPLGSAGYAMPFVFATRPAPNP